MLVPGNRESGGETVRRQRGVWGGGYPCIRRMRKRVRAGRCARQWVGRYSLRAADRSSWATVHETTQRASASGCLERIDSEEASQGYQVHRARRPPSVWLCEARFVLDSREPSSRCPSHTLWVRGRVGLVRQRIFGGPEGGFWTRLWCTRSEGQCMDGASEDQGCGAAPSARLSFSATTSALRAASSDFHRQRPILRSFHQTCVGLAGSSGLLAACWARPRWTSEFSRD